MADSKLLDAYNQSLKPLNQWKAVLGRHGKGDPLHAYAQQQVNHFQQVAHNAHQSYLMTTNYGLNTSQTTAFDLMSQTLTSWGLGALVPDLKKFIVKGDTNPDTLSLALSQTAAYKQRFAGNETRVKNGLPSLSPAEYIATEESYRNLMRSYGMPQGFYDKQEDFTKFISNDVSPSELESKLKIATDQYTQASPAAREIWQKYFGLSQGDAIANLIDPTRFNLTDLQSKAAQVGIGTAASEQGFNLSQQRAQQFQQQGVTLDQAKKAYSDIAQAFGTDQNIASRFGTTLNQSQEENARLLNQGPDLNKLNTLYGEEQALFKSKAGANANSFAPNLSSTL